MRAQPVNFERGQDPKSSMGVGVAAMIPEITSDDLMIMQFGWTKNNTFSPSMFKKEYSFDDFETGEFDEIFERIKKVALALQGKVKWDRYFDWKEYDEMEDYLNSNKSRKYIYPYNAAPGMDGIQVVWSKVLLPSAEKIE